MSEASRTEQDLAGQLAEWSDLLRHICANGSNYANNRYDRDNYQRIQEIALQMMALSQGTSLTGLAPLQPALLNRPGPLLSRLTWLGRRLGLRPTFFYRPSPVPVVDAAVFNAEDKLLLIRRADNGRWAMPGGGCDVGETPAQTAAREALEETGYQVEPRRLIAVHDSRYCGGRHSAQLYQFIFLCQVRDVPPETPSHANETLGCGWFAQSELPPAHEIDPNHITRLPLVFAARQGQLAEPYFDKEGL